MDVFYPIYLFDPAECTQKMKEVGCTFEVVAIGDEDSPGLAVPASGDFPYDYDYTCEWDASLIYLEIRQSMEPEQCDLCDSVLGPLFLFKNLLDPDNYRFFAYPPIRESLLQTETSEFPKEWYSNAVRLFSLREVQQMLTKWSAVDSENLFRLARNFFPQFDDNDIFQNPEDFELFVQSWLNSLKEAQSQSLCVVQVYAED
jgi:hypothetical protein